MQCHIQLLDIQIWFLFSYNHGSGLPVISDFCWVFKNGGTQKINTTAYHPISNKIIVQFHRHLKSPIKAHEIIRLTEMLPIVVLCKAFEQQGRKIRKLLAQNLFSTLRCHIPVIWWMNPLSNLLTIILSQNSEIPYGI